RPYYEGRDSDKSVDTAESEVCRKFYSTYTKQSLTGGLMALWCPHLICLGFHKMPHAEGRNDIFSALFKYFEKAPETVVYDFACQLAPYCMSRKPLFQGWQRAERAEHQGITARFLTNEPAFLRSFASMSRA